MPARLVLASASPARLAALRAAGLAPEVVVSGVDETGVDHLPGPEAVRVLAERKADAVAARSLADGGDTGAGAVLVLACDSMLAVGGAVRGKPSSADEARRWWRAMRGTTGTLLTGHALVEVATGRRAAATAETVVRFGCPTDAEIDAYVASGEPLAVSGAFTLDGRSAPFVDGIDGDHGTVLGVSLPLVRRLLAGLDVAITDLWAPVP